MDCLMSKILVAYFSWGGKTKALARAVAVKSGADLFQIKTIKDYSRMYLMAIAEAKMEHIKNEHPAIMGKPADFGQYDTVMIGFPIWWYTCPNAILTFLEENDFKGKTIIPFCTYGSSGKGKSEQDMQAMCPEAKFEPCVEATGLKDKAVSYLAEIVNSRK